MLTTRPDATNWSKPAVWLLCLAVAVGWYMLVSHLTTSAPLASATSTSSQE